MIFFVDVLVKRWRYAKKGWTISIENEFNRLCINNQIPIFARPGLKPEMNFT